LFRVSITLSLTSCRKEREHCALVEVKFETSALRKEAM
jgi:hypothetical protein